MRRLYLREIGRLVLAVAGVWLFVELGAMAGLWWVRGGQP